MQEIYWGPYVEDQLDAQEILSSKIVYQVPVAFLVLAWFSLLGALKEKVLQKKKQEEEELKRKMATGEYYGFLDEIFMDLYMA